MKIYRHDATNHWIFFDRIAFLIIHPHERYPNIIHWNKRFNRLKIGDRIEFQFGKIPDYWLNKGPILNKHNKELQQKLAKLKRR